MTQLMVIPNPRRRHKRRRPMTAKQRKYFGKRRRSTTIVVRRNPTPAVASSSPPRGRSRRRISRLVRTYFAAARRRSRGMGRGLIGELTSFVSNDLVPASIGAGGALALDMLWPYLPLPAALQAGAMVPLVRIAGAVGIGYAVSAVAGKSMGRQAMTGALIVTMYDVAKDMIATSMPAPATTNAYVGVYDDQLGYASPAMLAGRHRRRHRQWDNMGVYAN